MKTEKALKQLMKNVQLIIDRIYVERQDYFKGIKIFDTPDTVREHLIYILQIAQKKQEGTDDA